MFATPTREISAQPPRQRPRWLLERQPEECISLNGGKEKKRRRDAGGGGIDGEERENQEGIKRKETGTKVFFVRLIAFP